MRRLPQSMVAALLVLPSGGYLALFCGLPLLLAFLGSFGL